MVCLDYYATYVIHIFIPVLCCPFEPSMASLRNLQRKGYLLKVVPVCLLSGLLTSLVEETKRMFVKATAAPEIVFSFHRYAIPV